MICVAVWNRRGTGIIEERYFPETASGSMKAKGQQAEYLARYPDCAVDFYQCEKQEHVKRG